MQSPALDQQPQSAFASLHDAFQKYGSPVKLFRLCRQVVMSCLQRLDHGSSSKSEWSSYSSGRDSTPRLFLSSQPALAAFQSSEQVKAHMQGLDLNIPSVEVVVPSKHALCYRSVPFSNVPVFIYLAFPCLRFAGLIKIESTHYSKLFCAAKEDAHSFRLFQPLLSAQAQSSFCRPTLPFATICEEPSYQTATEN